MQIAHFHYQFKMDLINFNTELTISTVLKLTLLFYYYDIAINSSNGLMDILLYTEYMELLTRMMIYIKLIMSMTEATNITTQNFHIYD